MGFKYYLTSAKVVSGNDETLGFPGVLDNLTANKDVCKSLIREMCKEPCLMHLLISQKKKVSSFSQILSANKIME